MGPLWLPAHLFLIPGYWLKHIMAGVSDYIYFSRFKSSTAPAMESLKAFMHKQNPEFTEKDVQEIVDLFEPYELPAKQYLLEAGRKADYLCYLEEGLIRVYGINEEGEERTVFFFKENTLLTDVRSMVTGEPSKFYLQAVEPCKIFRARIKDVYELYSRNKAVERGGFMLTEKLLISIEKRLYSFIFHSPEARYRRLLERSPELLMRVPQQYLASYLGITPVSLSRIKARVQQVNLNDRKGS